MREKFLLSWRKTCFETLWLCFLRRKFDGSKTPKNCCWFGCLSKFQPIVLHNYKLDFFLQGAQWFFSICEGGLDPKIKDFFLLNKVLIVRNYTKSADKIDLFLNSNYYIFVITGLISSIKSSIGNSAMLQRDSTENSPNLIRTSKCWQNENLDKCYFCWFISMFKLRFHGN